MHNAAADHAGLQIAKIKAKSAGGPVLANPSGPNHVCRRPAINLERPQTHQTPRQAASVVDGMDANTLSQNYNNRTNKKYLTELHGTTWHAKSNPEEDHSS